MVNFLVLHKPHYPLKPHCSQSTIPTPDTNPERKQSMKAFKYTPSSQQPTIRVVEMESPHHDYTYNHRPTNGGTSFSAATPPPIDDPELSIFDAQKYFNETNEKPKTDMITTNPSLIPQPPFENLPTSLPRRMSSSVASSAASNGFTYSANGARVRRFSFPTASSEASWNSQTGLLANRPGSVQVKLREFQSDNETQKRESSSSWFFRLKCPCAGKKSIGLRRGKIPSSTGNNYTHHNKRENQNPEAQIKTKIITTEKEITAPISHSPEVVNHDSSPPPSMIHHRQQRISSSGTGNPFHDGNSMAFSFPILNQTFPAPVPKMEVLRRSLPPLMAANDPPRDSLEVFQPQDNSVPSNPLLSPNLSGGGGRGFSFLGSPTKAARDDDAMSDASSDLFEIESFSTQQTSSTYPMYYYQRRDSFEEATTFNARRKLAVATGGGMAGGRRSYSRRSIDEEEVMNESEYCYEPSEASIDWSVTTAEGFDRASMTNYSIATSEREREWEVRGGAMGGSKVKNNKTKGMGLLSCRHENAVMSMGPQPMRCVAEEGQGGAVAAGAVGLAYPFQFMSTLRHV